MAPTKRPDFTKHAEAVYNGDGTFRAPEMIKRDIRVALEEAYQQGRHDQSAQSRQSLLLEHKLIIDGLRQSIDARAKTLEIELNEMEEREKRTRECHRPECDYPSDHSGPCSPRLGTR